MLGCPLSHSAHHNYCSLYRTHRLCGGGAEPAWSFVVHFKVVTCIAVKCDCVVFRAVLFLQKMTDFKEQCLCIKLLFQIGKIGAETFQVLTFAFREEAMRQIVVFDCPAKSRNGMTSVKDAEYSGCLPTGRRYRNVEHIYRIWRESRCITIHKLANELGSLMVYTIRF